MTTARNSCTLCGGNGHNQAACPWRSESTEAQRVAADLALNFDKAHRLNNEAFVKAMEEQIKKGELA